MSKTKQTTHEEKPVVVAKHGPPAVASPVSPADWSALR